MMSIHLHPLPSNIIHRAATVCQAPTPVIDGSPLLSLTIGNAPLPLSPSVYVYAPLVLCPLI